MRYNLDSTLPINAFSPRGGRSPFSRGMTLEGGGGGGGVLSPITNAVSGIAKGVTDVVKGVVQPVYNATIKNIPVVGPAIDKALVSVDKSVGKAIPGGWGTVASVATSFIPGAQPFAVGIGALNGSGVMRGNHQFNLQGAIMGGAMAYGASQFAQGLENAADPATNATTKAIEETAKAETGNIASNLGVQGASTAPGSQAAMLAQQNAGMGAAGLESIKSGANQAIQSNLANAGANAIANAGSNAAGADVFSGLAGTQGAIPPVAVPQPTSLESLGTNLTNAGKGTLSNISDAGKGIANLTGFGDKGFSGVSDAFTAFKEPITNTGIAAGLIGYSGMAALEQQQKELDAQKAAGTISSAQYDTAKARIDQEVAAARANISENPLQTSADISSVSQAPTLYAGRSRTDTLYDKEPKGGSALLYAAGGNVLMNPPDDQTGMPNQSPMQNLDQGGLMSMVNRTIPQQTFAAGGITNPRFLSGGGDGMSDSIPATINGKQEARLADGEFVIPADVVSHLGNGSSKAGAKQLYSMMDKVRQARTGNKNQGKQINPRKYLAA